MKQFFYSNETKINYKLKIILIFIFNTSKISTLIFFLNFLFDHDFLCLFLKIVFKLKNQKSFKIFYKNKDIWQVVFIKIFYNIP